MDEAVPEWASASTQTASAEPTETPTWVSEDTPGWAKKGAVKDTSTSGPVKAFAKGAVENTLPSMAGLAAFPSGAMGGAALAAIPAAFTGPLAPVVEGAGALIGGVTAALGAGYAASKVQETIVPEKLKKATGFDEATRKREIRENPLSSFAGQLAPNLLSFRPGSLEAVQMAGREVGPWAQRTLLTASGAGMEVGQEKYHGEKLSPEKIAMSAVFMGVAAKPTKLGDKIMSTLVPKSRVTDPGSKDWTTEDLKKEWEVPKEINGIPIRVGKVKEEPHPNSLKETGFKNKDTGEITPTGDKHDPELKDSSPDLEQGFITHGGEFKNRFEAADLANEHHAGDLENKIDYQGVEGDKPSTTKQPGLHSTDFGPGGLSKLKKIQKDAVNSDGSPVLARHIQNPDGSPKEIVLDKDAIVASFIDKPWANPKTEGVKALPEDMIKSPQDLVQFYAMREEFASKQQDINTSQDFEKLLTKAGLSGFISREQAATIRDKIYSSNDIPAARRAALSKLQDTLKEHGIEESSKNRPVSLDDTEPPKYLYHGTKTSDKYLLDKDGNLVLTPAKNFGGKTNSVSLTHNKDYADDYAARVKGGGPDGFDFRGARTIKIESDSLPKTNRESGEEWAINTDKPVTIPKGKFEIVEHPLANKSDSFFKENPDYTWRDYLHDNYSEQEIDQADESIYSPDNIDQYMTDAWGTGMDSEYNKIGMEHEKVLKDKKKEVDRLKQIVEKRSAGEYKEPPVEWKSTPKVSKADHENLVNELAMEKFAEENKGYNVPDASVPPIPKSPTDFSNALFSFGKNKEHDNSIASQRLLAAEQEGVDLPMKERWRKFAEGDKDIILSDKELELFNKYVGQESIERMGLVKYSQDKGWVLPLEMDPEIAGLNVAREVAYPEQTLKETLREKLTGNKGGFDQNIAKTPGGAKERGYFVAESPSGKRTVVSLADTDKGLRINQYNDGHTSPFSSGETLKAGDKVGQHTIKEATVDEIEKHTSTRYNKDYQAVLYKRLTELREFVRGNQFVEDLKGSDYFKEVAVKMEPNEGPPKGFQVPEHMDKLPQLRDYAFTPEVAEILSDFSKDWKSNAVNLLSGALIKNMMLNPLPHMLNEGWHLYNYRGLSGWITPMGIARFVKTGVPAVHDVMTQGPRFRSLLKDGASLLSADVRNSAIQESFFRKGAKEFTEHQLGKDLAKEYGMTPLALYDAVSKASSKAMWTVRDMMYMQLIDEKMKYEGMSQKEAIGQVEKHMPSYRLPPRVGKVLGSQLSRSLSQTLQNPNITAFSPYHYGLVKSLVETAKDVGAIRHGKSGLKQFAHGVDSAAAIAVAIGILFPLQDMLIHKLTGNDNASSRKAGPYHPIDAIWQVTQETKDPQAVLASVFTFNPALLMAGQFIANRKLYNGQQVYRAGSEVPDLEKYFLGQVPQVQTSLTVSSDETGGGAAQWLAKQADINAPSEEAQRRVDKNIKRLQTAAANRKRKRENAD